MTFTVNDIQQRYSVTQQTVLGWIANGELKAINVGRAPGKKKPRWRITQAALDSFEAIRQSGPPLPKTRRRRKADPNVIEFIK